MTLESKAAPMAALYVAGLAVGLLLMYLARDFTLARSNTLAGFLLGALIAGLSLAAMVVGESRRVELDVPGRRIVLEITRRWGGAKVLVFPFADIQEITIGRMGSRSEGSVYYDLVVRRRDGREVYLFGGCVFEGRMSREWIEDLRATFTRALG
jgi:hypothetical protein